MKITYLAQVGLLDNWAHTVQIMKMCEAFAQNGVDLTLLVAKRKNKNNQEAFDLYGVSKIFKIKEVPYIDLFQGSTLSVFYYIRLISFIISSRIFLTFYKYDILYTRELNASLFFKNVFLELHSFPKNIKFFQKLILKKAKGFVVLTSFIKEKITNLGVLPDRVLVAHDGVKLEDFKEDLSNVKTKESTGLSKEDFLIGYIGTLKTMGMEKGVGTAIESLQFLPPNYKLYVVGGELEDINFYKKYAKKLEVENQIIFYGKVNHREIPEHIKLCDVVIAPFPKTDHYSYFMSPLKIFEYMASKKPIIVSDLPSLREVLVDNETALFVPPNDSKKLAHSIQMIASDEELGQRISNNAYKEVVEKYTWQKRAKNIIDFIK
jgi:glycosyltransferase involved in cell wall biosynthesis